jgi:hypothetical protein
MLDNHLPDELTGFASTPAEEIADALFVCDTIETSLQEGLTTTQELPAIPMAELVAASTYKDEELALRMWDRAIDHLEADEQAQVESLRLSDDRGTQPELALIESLKA